MQFDMAKTRSRARVAAVAASALLVLAACGGKDPAAKGGPQNNDAKATGSKGTVTVGLLNPATGPFAALGTDVNAGFEAYLKSKGGVLSMSRELGVQFARKGVRVNALCPGPVNTPLLQELFAADADKAARRLVHVPMGRFGEPDEMANAVLFLASDESSFVTASTFLVDGGISAAYVTPL